MSFDVMYDCILSICFIKEMMMMMLSVTSMYHGRAGWAAREELMRIIILRFSLSRATTQHRRASKRTPQKCCVECIARGVILDLFYFIRLTHRCKKTFRNK